MYSILKSKSTRLLSALLAVLMIVAMLPTTAFAWSVEEGTKCTSTYGDHYVGSDGEMFYSKPTTTAIFYNDDGSYYVKSYASGNAKYKYMMIDESGNYHHVYCIEGGVTFDYSDTYNSTSGKNSKYFQNLPVTAQFGIMMALMYGCLLYTSVTCTRWPATAYLCRSFLLSGRKSKQLMKSMK